MFAIVDKQNREQARFKTVRESRRARQERFSAGTKYSELYDIIKLDRGTNQ